MSVNTSERKCVHMKVGETNTSEGQCIQVKESAYK